MAFLFRTVFRAALLHSCSLLFAASTLSALPFDEVVVFGDGLSDVGNLQALAPPGTLIPPSSNGPLTLEHLVAKLNLPALTPSFHLNNIESGTLPIASGNDFAIVGARALDMDGNLTTPDIGLPTQVSALLANNSFVAPADKLYVFFIGAGDILDAGDLMEDELRSLIEQEKRRSLKQHGKKLKDDKGGKKSKGGKKDSKTKKGKKDPFSWKDVEVYQETDARVRAGAASELVAIETLMGLGAQHVLVVSAPDVGVAPDPQITAKTLLEASSTRRNKALAKALPQVHTDFSVLFNTLLKQGLEEINRDLASGKAVMFDLFTFIQDVASSGQFAFTEEPCLFTFSQNGTVNPACTGFPVASEFMFWDEFRATTAVNKMAGEDVAALLEASYA